MSQKVNDRIIEMVSKLEKISLLKPAKKYNKQPADLEPIMGLTMLAVSVNGGVYDISIVKALLENGIATMEYDTGETREHLIGTRKIRYVVFIYEDSLYIANITHSESKPVCVNKEDDLIEYLKTNNLLKGK